MAQNTQEPQNEGLKTETEKLLITSDFIRNRMPTVPKYKHDVTILLPNQKWKKKIYKSINYYNI